MDTTLAWVRSVLATTAGRWTTLAESVPADLLSLQPAPKQWSAVECLEHMIDVEAVFAFRLHALLTGQDFPGFDPDSQGAKPQKTAVELARSFAHGRAENLATLARLTDADLTRVARHQELGPVTLSQVLNEWAAHDLNHTVQAERAIVQPFIAGCGPWQPYFADHVVK